ncbi:hypothetical protein N5912_00645 [Arcobacter lacus]|uniref:hypothetical protein n=1 Tax=Arcobacter lacus TaxID=1912876 RepID=UPI0021BB745A|nr:hypothetical protein [Arcobacter lacus]MCT7910326.1 hypothetical protein [Arcobacter lacus]
MIDISTFDIGKYIIASGSGLVLIIGLFILAIGVQKNEKFISLAFSIIYIAMGIFVMSGVFADILFIGIIDDAENFNDSSFYYELSYFIGILPVAVGVYVFFNDFYLPNKRKEK